VPTALRSAPGRVLEGGDGRVLEGDDGCVLEGDDDGALVVGAASGTEGPLACNASTAAKPAAVDASTAGALLIGVLLRPSLATRSGVEDSMAA
jgi:hypothetical protein